MVARSNIVYLLATTYCCGSTFPLTVSVPIPETTECELLSEFWKLDSRASGFLFGNRLGFLVDVRIFVSQISGRCFQIYLSAAWQQIIQDVLDMFCAYMTSYFSFFNMLWVIHVY